MKEHRETNEAYNEQENLNNNNGISNEMNNVTREYKGRNKDFRSSTDVASIVVQNGMKI